MNPDFALSPAVLSALQPRFSLERQVGAGGMATVFLARDERNNRPVALKVLREEAMASAGVERFEREIQLLGRLQHPLILPLHDSGVAGDAMYFVMPFVEGETLRDRMSREGQLPVDEALRIAIEVADALAYAHGQGVVHRDIKPENIMLWRGHAVVCDFGIASIIQGVHEGPGHERLTHAGHWLGTPGYMSPEQAAGDPHVGAASDQYSLGLSLYEMLGGSAPFVGTLRSVLARQITDAPPPITTMRSDLSATVVSALERAIAKAPEQRWESTASFGAALRRALAGSSLAAPAPESVDARLSLAILPFDNLGGDGENAFFSDGITEELIGSISRLPRLRVVSRASAFAFRDKDLDLAEIGARLRVGFVLSGSVRRAGDRLRLAAQLCRVADDAVIWSEVYERRMVDVFDVQDDLARRITATVRQALGTGEAVTPLQVRHPRSVTAYDQYLLGRYTWNRRTASSLQEGLRCFQRAIEADPDFAPAYAGLADSHALMASSGVVPPRVAYPEARVAALRSIALDPSLAEGHASLGLINLNYEWDWPGAEQAFRRALELNPSYSTACQWYSSFLSSMARHDEAIEVAQRAAALDPFSVVATIRIGIAYSHAMRHDEAASTLERAMAMDSANLSAQSWLTMAYLALGRHDEARRMAEGAYAASHRAPALHPLVAFVLRAMGQRDDARAIIDERLRAPDLNPFGRAVLALWNDDLEQCFSSLHQGVDERGDQMHSLRTNPYFAAARGDARFDAVLQRLGLASS